MKIRRSGLTGLLVALAMIAGACGDDSDDSTGSTGAEESDGDFALPASCVDDGDAGEDPGDEEGDAEDAAADDGPAGELGGELTEVTVGILPVADLAPLYYGIDQGFFEEEGLDLSLEIGQGGAAMVPSVLQGDFQFAFGNYLSLMQARENNVGMQIVSNIVNGADTADRGTNALLVDPDVVGSIDDLAGRTFAVTTVENVGDVNIRTTLAVNGVDDSGINIVEMGFPEMNAAVESGQIDVAWTAEPFVTLGEQAGLVSLVDPMHATTPNMPLAGIFAEEGWLEDNSEVANAFYRAMQRSLEASSDDEAMKDAIVENTETDAALVEQLALANWDPALNLDKLGCVGELSVDYGILDDEPNLDELVWDPD